MSVNSRLNRRRTAAIIGSSLLLPWSAAQADEAPPVDLTDLLSEEQIRSLPTKWTMVETVEFVSYRREVKYNGVWHFAGITLPVCKATRQAVKPDKHHLDPRLVPKDIRGFEVTISPVTDDSDVTGFRPPSHLPDEALRSRHGQPPSQWIRSRNAKQLSRWLRTLDIPYVGVEQISFWDHLVDHHQFRPKFISGLTRNELAMLHSAAHYGY